MAFESDRARSGAAYEGWLYHVGVNSLGYQFCRSRYLIIKGKYVEMYTCNPYERPRKPVRRGVVGTYCMVEELGRQIYHGRALYVLRIYSRVDCHKQGKLACSSAGEVEKWISAFHHAKEELQAEDDNERASFRVLMSNEEEFKLSGRRHHPRSYTRLSRNPITIGRGPESLLWRPSMVAQDPDDADDYFKHHENDAVEQEDWKCIMIVNGLRIFEDVSSLKHAKKGYKFMKSMGVVEANPDQIFDMIMTLDKNQRHQWDILTGDLIQVEDIDGHSDIVYGVYHPRYHRRWCLKQDFLFLRRWRHDQDGSYSITEDSAIHKKFPWRIGHRRIKLNPSVWEITPLPSRCGTSRSLVTQIMEIKPRGCSLLRKIFPSKFHKTIPYFLLCRTAGLREFFTANNEDDSNLEQLQSHSVLSPQKEREQVSFVSTQEETEPLDVNEQFYDAIALEDQPEEDDCQVEEQLIKNCKGSSSWSVRLGLPSKRPPNREENGELVLNAKSVDINLNLWKASLRPGKCDGDSDCWSDPGGKSFMVRGRTYAHDFIKVPGGDPLLKLLGVDWLKHDQKMNAVARHPRCLVKNEEVKKLPFILIVNLQIPAKPNYSLVFYYGADRPIRPGSLLHKFTTADDAFRNSRLKFIPRIVEGYWVVKRAVGTKACLLGRALTCKYLREDNFLEIDVDVGSSSVARSVCGLVLGYATSVVIDFAVLIEAQDESELPEYLLGVSRIHRINPESAQSYEEM